jgi:hypothetical protein
LTHELPFTTWAFVTMRPFTPSYTNPLPWKEVTGDRWRGQVVSDVQRRMLEGGGTVFAGSRCTCKAHLPSLALLRRRPRIAEHAPEQRCVAWDREPALDVEADDSRADLP